MELTQKIFAERLERLRHLATQSSDDFETLRATLHEKGVECTIIVPLLEVLLDFNALADVTYEQASESHHGQRFDFLVEDRLLIEAKELGANLDEHFKQVSTYIAKNDNINYGILTNGIDFEFWVQKSFIEKVGDTQLLHTDTVAKLFELSLEDDTVPFLIDVFLLFTKTRYEETFKTIASVAAYYASGSRGRPAVVHTDRDIDEELRKRIRNNVVVQKGVYYEEIVAGNLAAGDKLRFKNDVVEITVELTPTGTVVLRKTGANVIDMMAALKDGWSHIIPLISERWSKSDTEFQDPVEIIKLALNKQRLYGKERYNFEKVMPWADGKA